MSWSSFLTGVLTVLFAFALFKNDENEDMEVEQDMPLEKIFNVNSSTGRYVTLSCQTCRKLKRHQEIETNLYECTKCKRLIDLR